VAPPSREFQAGDLVCTSCGEANDHARKFCSRCGSSLSTATVHEPTLPWYRRLLARLPRLDRSPEAAKRRRRRWIRVINGARVTRSGISLVVIVVLLLYATVPPFRSAVNGRVSAVQAAVQRLVSPTYEPVHALSATATSSVADHPPSAAIDGYNNTYWAADLSQDPQPVLILSFARPVTIDAMLFTSGVPGDFTSEARPMQIHLVFSNGTAKDAHLSDKASYQQVDISGAAGVAQVEIHIVSAYPSVRGSQVALTEVEMFTRQ
jgi:hypothetical protein